MSLKTPSENWLRSALRPIAGCFLVPLFLFAQQAGHRVAIEDLLSLRSVTALSVAPDGTRIAYVVSGKLYVKGTAGRDEPVLIGSGNQPVWSPDGKSIAWYGDRGGSTQIFIAPLSGEASIAVPGVQGHIDQSSPPSWSPDGKMLAFTMLVPGRDRQAPSSGASPQVFGPESPPLLSSRDMFRAVPPDPDPVRREVALHSIKGGTPRTISSDRESAAQPVWSPGGGAVAFVSRKDLAANDTELVQVTVAGGDRSLLASSSGAISSPRWSPDGRQIAYIADASRYGLFSAAWIAEPGTGVPARNISKIVDRAVLDLNWSSDSQSLMVELWDGVDQPLGQLSLDGRFTRLTHGDAGRSMLRASRNVYVWVESDPKHHHRILAVGPDSSEPVVLLDANPQIAGWSLGDQKVIHWRNSRGETIDGIVVLPPDYVPGHGVPLIVDPYSHMANDFKRILPLASQYLAAQGYAVLMPNHRGFFSFPESLKGVAYGQVAQLPEANDIMADDVLSGVDQLVRDGIADPDRLGLFSFSTGASAIEVLLTKTNRFKAAVCAGGVSDWIHYYLLRPPSDDTIPNMLKGRTPWSSPDVYRDLSPIYQADRIHTPLLLAVGDRDSRLIDAVEFYQALRRLKRNVTLVRYPDQGHGFAPDPLRDYLTRSLQFFRANGL